MRHRLVEAYVLFVWRERVQTKRGQQADDKDGKTMIKAMKKKGEDLFATRGVTSYNSSSLSSSSRNMSFLFAHNCGFGLSTLFTKRVIL
jgi:hypothetical protein